MITDLDIQHAVPAYRENLRKLQAHRLFGFQVRGYNLPFLELESEAPSELVPDVFAIQSAILERALIVRPGYSFRVRSGREDQYLWVHGVIPNLGLYGIKRVTLYTNHENGDIIALTQWEDRFWDRLPRPTQKEYLKKSL